MAIGSYPRFAVQGTGNGQNIQNGTALMIFNTVTNRYEAVTEATFSGALVLAELVAIKNALLDGTAAVQIADEANPTSVRASVNANNKLSVVI